MVTFRIVLFCFSMFILFCGLSVSQQQRPPEFDKYKRLTDKQLLTAVGSIITPVKFGMKDITDPKKIGNKHVFVYRYTEEPFHFPELERYCNTDWRDTRLCMEAFYHFATSKYKDKMKNTMFALKIVMTASYYLCSRANQADVHLKLMDGHRCFTHQEQARYNIDMAYYMANVPFRCARRYFCPDPCQKNTHNEIPKLCKNCKVYIMHNINVDGLRHNQWNVTDCPCAKEYRWVNTKHRCVKNNHECSNHINDCGEGASCHDQIVGYTCKCQKGYHIVRRREHQVCVRDGEEEEKKYGEHLGNDPLKNTFQNFERLTNNQLVSALGKYLKHYKFDSYDLTDKNEKRKKGELLYRFPKKLVRMPQIEKYCSFDTEKARQCMEAILQLRQHTWRNEFHDKEFEFMFTTVANYYLCWFTFMRIEPMKHIAQENCFTADERRRYRPPENYWVDNKRPFYCAEAFFCPDACKMRLGNSQELCSQSGCTFRRWENVNAHGMMTNFWNITCTCPKNHLWNKYKRICVTKFNECEKGTDTCGKYASCHDTDLLFECTCPAGYHIEIIKNDMNQFQKVRSDCVNNKPKKTQAKKEKSSKKISRSRSATPRQNYGAQLLIPRSGLKEQTRREKYQIIWAQSSKDSTFSFRFKIPAIIVLFSFSIILKY